MTSTVLNRGNACSLDVDKHFVYSSQPTLSGCVERRLGKMLLVALRLHVPCSSAAPSHELFSLLFNWVHLLLRLLQR